MIEFKEMMASVARETLEKIAGATLFAPRQEADAEGNLTVTTCVDTPGQPTRFVKIRMAWKVGSMEDMIDGETAENGPAEDPGDAPPAPAGGEVPADPGADPLPE